LREERGEEEEGEEEEGGEEVVVGGCGDDVVLRERELVGKGERSG
jgi:hypothetical protein